jgi:hypothetical protein
MPAAASGSAILHVGLAGATPALSRVLHGDARGREPPVCPTPTTHPLAELVEHTPHLYLSRVPHLLRRGCSQPSAAADMGRR